MTGARRNGPMERQHPAERLEQRLADSAALVDELIDRYGLPLHLVFLEELAESVRSFREVLARVYPRSFVALAVKCNPCRGAVRAAGALGLGVDVVSEHELRAALEEGIDSSRIVCNGNAKSDVYLLEAASAGATVAVDGEEELAHLDRLGRRAAHPVPALLRISGLSVKGFTSASQTTADRWSKFGFAASELPRILERLAECRGVRFRGFSAHIGTQLCRPEAYFVLLERMLQLAAQARALGLDLEMLDLGGGWPVNFVTRAEWRRLLDRLRAQVAGTLGHAESVTWNNHPMGFAHLVGAPVSAADRWIGKAYWSAHPGASMLEHVLTSEAEPGVSMGERLRALGEPTLVVEPGRSLMAGTGVTITRALTTKSVLGHLVVAVDMGINNHGTNLLAPDIFPAAVLPHRADDRPVEAFLAGRLCFGGDILTTAKVLLNRCPRRGERLGLFLTGAYGADHFASHSCGFPRPAKVAIAANGTAQLWRPPEGHEAVFPPLDRSAGA